MLWMKLLQLVVLLTLRWTAASVSGQLPASGQLPDSCVQTDHSSDVLDMCSVVVSRLNMLQAHVNIFEWWSYTTISL